MPVSQRLGRFVVLRVLGQGGTGTVYAAYDEKLDRKVAVKLVSAISSDAQTHQARVLREAQAMARISHPNVVQVFEVGELASQVFIAMEFIEGVTLTAWQREPGRSWKEILQLYRAAGQGLWAAHQAGLVHRDFKSENVLIGKDLRPRVLDFGLARLQGAHEKKTERAAVSEANIALTTPLTLDGAISGTPGYMSPEQYCGDTADHKSDQFSFCASLYEALYKQLPFAGKTLDQQSAAVRGGELRPPPADTKVPVEIWKALKRGMSTAPADRFNSLAELLAALEVESEGDPAGAWLARRRLSIAVGLATALIMTLSMAAHRNRPMSMQEIVAGSTLNGVAIFGALLALRKSLWHNAFHRGLLQLIILNIVQVFATRLTAWHLGVPFELYVPIDLLMLGGLIAIMAQRYLSGLWLTAAILAAGSLLSMWKPEQIFWITSVVYPLAPCSIIYFWNHAAQSKQPA